MFFVYILFSKSKNKYYVGSTGDELDERIRRHNTNHKGFTGKVGDWELVYKESFDSKVDALRREKEIKNKKSRRYIKRLVQNIPTYSREDQGSNPVAPTLYKVLIFKHFYLEHHCCFRTNEVIVSKGSTLMLFII
jgi:putative endonuclease